ncbi:MAG: hypothetical protein N2442_08215 [Spirochaetes bacterium]|nr:hypothetical protein [Spirochaetota bacterium]
MKTKGKMMIMFFLLGIAVGVISLSAQNLLDNPDYRKGLELQAQAKQAFEEGDYDRSIQLAAQAQEQFRKAREYAEYLRLRYVAYNLKNRATDRLRYADFINAAKNYPKEYTEARAAFQVAETAFNAERYQESVDGYRKVLDVLKDIQPLTPSPTEELVKVENLRNLILKYDLASAKPQEFQRAEEAYQKGKSLMDKDNAQAKYQLDAALKDYQTVFDTGMGAIAAKRRAELQAAKSKADEAQAPKFATELYMSAQKLQSDAEMQYASKAYEGAWESSGSAIELYLKSAEQARARAAMPAIPTLPEFYTVRLIPDRRDCFWRIAEYDFVYGDPWKWKILYEANKQLLPDPNNPDLILPGTRLRIPSIKGETRSGEWQGGK